MRNSSSPSVSKNYPPPWGIADQNLISPRRETESTRQLSCDVVFGSPSADCMGTGVCRISARTGARSQASQRKQSCRSTVALLFPIEGGNGLSLVLTRAFLCTQLYKNHLRTGVLTLESPCKLPKDIANVLELKFNELPVGQFPIYESAGFLRIDFKIAN